ncbi:hypothetical protein [Saccharothrix australiensis]|uniref:Uncharacterized protein n=1 Tax=Saccharothrix australiensis TaxID=2072 RepID=A0A495VVL4_9PSEU|nr:hypothetical protein [Saccharothrix australiensis]RKT52533.1 hypothetical protein C8E97_1050 [Saccharothrix australiensis]
MKAAPDDHLKPLLGVGGTVAAGVLAGVATGFTAYRAGAPVHWAALIALPVLALAVLVARLPRATDVLWSPPLRHFSSATSPQASALAGRLAEAAVDQDRFTTRVQPRLRRLAEARLRQRHGVPDADDPRAAALLGPELHRLVTDPAAPLPDPRKLTELLENL